MKFHERDLENLFIAVMRLRDPAGFLYGPGIEEYVLTPAMLKFLPKYPLGGNETTISESQGADIPADSEGPDPVYFLIPPAGGC